jgi:hypothetical protein
MPDPTRNAKLAKKIARMLFTNGAGQRADRLVLELPGKVDGGGWSEFAVAGQIQRLLDAESRRAR